MMLNQDLVRDFGGRAIVAVADQVAHRGKREKAPIGFGVEREGKLAAGKAIREVAVGADVAWRRKEIPDEQPVAIVMKRIEAAHVRQSEYRRPVRIKIVLAREDTRMIGDLRTEEFDIRGARVRIRAQRRERAE